MRWIQSLALLCGIIFQETSIARAESTFSSSKQIYNPNREQRSTMATKIPKPYGLIFYPNPHLNLLERIIAIVLYLFDLGGFRKLGKTEIGTQKSQEQLTKVRNMIAGSEKPLCKSSIQQWAAMTKGNLVAESTGSIPFRRDILRSWGILNHEQEKASRGWLENILDKAKPEEQGVKILVRFPASLLPPDVQKKGTVLDYSGCLGVDFQDIDLRTLAATSKVPVLVQFHGGGMVVGVTNDHLLVAETVDLINNAPENCDTNDLIVVSVDYRLAPEHPFPLGVLDALSAMEYLLGGNDKFRIHVSGNSAGANMSLVAGFEAFRKYPGKVASIQSQSPFVNPSADTMSYYMNQKGFPNIGFLRWCWRAYLGLEPPSDNDDDATTDLEKVLRKGSNYATWGEWKTQHPEPLHRLVNPALGIPPNMGPKNPKAPRIMIRYNRGDPLHNDGEMVVQALAGTTAKFYEEDGMHVNVFRPTMGKYPQPYWKVWGEMVFGNGDTK